MKPTNRSQRGVTILVVLMLMSVMMLGGLALARMAGVGTLVAGNITMKERALQASEVGVNTAYASLRALPLTTSNVGGWYFATALDQTAEGLPDGIDWSGTGPTSTSTTVGAYTVRYVVERMCSTMPNVNVERECLLKVVAIEPVDASGLAPPMAQQFRITVRVTGPKDTRTFVQALVTRG